MNTFLSKIALVGRPNVGKSALFNKLCKKRLSIVDEAEGVTRDRIYAESDCFGTSFIMIDTGGISPRKDLPYNELVKKQSFLAIEEADVVILVVDGHAGATPLDISLARDLQRLGKPIVLAVNKIDHPGQEGLIEQFSCLGIGDKIGVSATQNWHMAELLEAAISYLPKKEKEQEAPDSQIKVALIGRANTGKSTLLNHLLGEERSIVSELAGTTRDAIDADVIRGGQSFLFVDTAGIRRKSKEHEVIDKFAFIRTKDAINRCDICLVLLDSREGVSAQDKKILDMVKESGKPAILLFNKWDLVKGFRMEHCLKAVDLEASYLQHCPKIAISAKTGRNLEKIFPEILTVFEFAYKRISTHQLNNCLERSMQLTHPPLINGKRLRVYYVTQVENAPPRFILFVNHVHLISDTYRKYLENQLRKTFLFTGCPLFLHVKDKKKAAKSERKLPPNANSFLSEMNQIY